MIVVPTGKRLQSADVAVVPDRNEVLLGGSRRSGDGRQKVERNKELYGGHLVSHDLRCTV